MPRRSRWKRKKTMPRNKKILIACLPVLALVALAFGGYAFWLRTPPAMPETVEDVENLLTNKRYLRLSNADRRPYQEHMNEMWGDFSKEDRRRLAQSLRDNPEAGQDAMQQQMRNMFKVMVLNNNEAGRNAMFDLAINQMETADSKRRHQEEMAKRDTPEGREREEKARRWMMDWLDEGDPQTMGYGSEFFKLMNNRRKERGLPPL